MLFYGKVENKTERSEAENTMSDTDITRAEQNHMHIHEDGSMHPQHEHAHTHTNSKAVVNRMSRIIGHMTAVRTMVTDGRDCSEVLVQLAAVRSAINGVCKVILKDHIDHCLVDAVQTGDMEALDELNKAVELLMK